MKLNNKEINFSRIFINKMSELMQEHLVGFELGLKVEDWIVAIQPPDKKYQENLDKLEIEYKLEKKMVPVISKGIPLLEKGEPVMGWTGEYSNFNTLDRTKKKEYEKKINILQEKKIQLINVEPFTKDELKGFNFSRPEINSLKPLLEGKKDGQKS